jgi:hypothetical protein
VSDESRIAVHRYRSHQKASEDYVDVTFKYPNTVTWTGSIPVRYRRLGIELTTSEQIAAHLEFCYRYCDPATRRNWVQEQVPFWSARTKASVTKGFFDALATFEWSCVNCDLPPNPNWARRIQDLKEFGYTFHFRVEDKLAMRRGRQTYDVE